MSQQHSQIVNTGKKFPDSETDPSQAEPPVNTAPDTSDRAIPTHQEFRALLGISYPSGNAQINSVTAPLLSGSRLNVNGPSVFNGPINSTLILTRGAQLPDGTAAAPSLSFISDPTTGIYKSASGTVGFTSGGVSQVSIGGNALTVGVPVTTPPGQNLVINPGGSSVDFTGHTLINVGGISANPDYYQVTAPAPVVTINAAPTIILFLPLTNNAAYTIQSTVTCVDSTDGSSIGSFTLRTMAKNVSGIVTVTTPYITFTQGNDPALNGISAFYSSSGTNVTIVVTGLVATIIKWFAASVMTRQLF